MAMLGNQPVFFLSSSTMVRVHWPFVFLTAYSRTAVLRAASTLPVNAMCTRPSEVTRRATLRFPAEEGAMFSTVHWGVVAPSATKERVRVRARTEPRWNRMKNHLHFCNVLWRYETTTMGCRQGGSSDGGRQEVDRAQGAV